MGIQKMCENENRAWDSIAVLEGFQLEPHAEKLATKLTYLLLHQLVPELK